MNDLDFRNADDNGSCFSTQSHEMNWSIGTFQMECASVVVGVLDNNDNDCLSSTSSTPQRKKTKTTKCSIKNSEDAREVKAAPKIPEYVEYCAAIPVIGGFDCSGGSDEPELSLQGNIDCEAYQLLPAKLNDGAKSAETMKTRCHINHGVAVATNSGVINGMRLSQSAENFLTQAAAEELKVQMVLAENLLILERLRPCLLRSSMSHEALRQWDKQLGLPASHSRTMLSSKRTRDLLQEGFDLSNL